MVSNNSLAIRLADNKVVRWLLTLGVAILLGFYTGNLLTNTVPNDFESLYIKLAVGTPLALLPLVWWDATPQYETTWRKIWITFFKYSLFITVYTVVMVWLSDTPINLAISTIPIQLLFLLAVSINIAKGQDSSSSFKSILTTLLILLIIVTLTSFIGGFIGLSLFITMLIAGSLTLMYSFYLISRK